VETYGKNEGRKNFKEIIITPYAILWD